MNFYKAAKGTPYCPTHGVPLRGEAMQSTLWSAWRCIVGGELHFKSKTKEKTWERPGSNLYHAILAV